MSLLNRLGGYLEGDTDDVLGSQGRKYLFGTILVLFLLTPIVEILDPYLFNLMTEILIFVLLALSLDFVFGYTGLPSFGHAAMFGTGGYVAAFILRDLTANLVVVILAAMFFSVIVAFIIGVLSIRGKGVFFAFLTLAFAQIFYIAVFQDLPAILLSADSVTNGDNGLVGVASFELFGFQFGDSYVYYLLTLVLVALSVAVIIRLANSPFGRALQGIRESEDRMAALGYDVARYKVTAFVLSGAFAGISGALFVPLESVAHPEMLHWTMSGDLIIMVLIGGMGTLWGSMIGAAGLVLFEDIMSQFANWHLLLGILFVLVVIFLPSGIAGGFRTLRKEPGAAMSNVKNAIKRYVENIRD